MKLDIFGLDNDAQFRIGHYNEMRDIYGFVVKWTKYGILGIYIHSGTIINVALKSGDVCSSVRPYVCRFQGLNRSSYELEIADKEF